jgi:biopolymer transport protein ExbB/TolQ
MTRFFNTDFSQIFALLIVDSVSTEAIFTTVAGLIVGLVVTLYRIHTGQIEKLETTIETLWNKIHELKDADAKHRETQAKLEAKLEGIEKRLEKIPDQAALTSILTSVLTTTLTTTLTTALKESEARLERYVDMSLKGRA